MRPVILALTAPWALVTLLVPMIVSAQQTPVPTVVQPLRIPRAR
jgi:hypothetical protein